MHQQKTVRVERSNMRLYLSDLRLDRGYSQRRLAREANMSVSHYSRLESGERGGKVTLIVMGRIAKALHADLNLLYKAEEAYLEEVYKKEEAKQNHK